MGVVVVRGGKRRESSEKASEYIEGAQEAAQKSHPTKTHTRFKNYNNQFNCYLQNTKTPERENFSKTVRHVDKYAKKITQNLPKKIHNKTGKLFEIF